VKLEGALYARLVQFGHERPLGTGERVAHQEIIVKGLLVLLGKAGR
jgi:hypothetical protein